tara:strand:- start:115 stop:594 length:480 start_codon:yes stop_codon:yes gene_type:complete
MLDSSKTLWRHTFITKLEPEMLKKLFIFKVSLYFLLLGCFSLAYSQGKGHIHETISTQRAVELIANHKDDADFIIVDVRTPAEFKEGHIENSKLLDYYSKSFVDNLKRLDKTKTYLIYCRSGNRSGKTLVLIKDMGFQEVYNMGKGIKGWRSAGFPLKK